MQATPRAPLDRRPLVPWTIGFGTSIGVGVVLGALTHSYVASALPVIVGGLAVQLAVNRLRQRSAIGEAGKPAPELVPSGCAGWVLLLAPLAGEWLVQRHLDPKPDPASGALWLGFAVAAITVWPVFTGIER